MHLEVPQVAAVDDRTVLLFSCDSPALSGARAGTRGGIWALSTESTVGPYDAASATLLAPETLYSGRVIQNRDGDWVLLAFENSTTDGGFVGRLSDPLPLAWSRGDGALELRMTSGELA